MGERLEHVPDHQGNESETAGLGELLLPCREYDDLPGTGQLAEAEIAGHFVAAVETEQNPSKEPDQAGIFGRRSMAVRPETPRPLGRGRNVQPASSAQEYLLRETGSVLASGAVPPTSARILNRRVRNRTHGGVGGRRGRPRLLPD